MRQLNLSMIDSRFNGDKHRPRFRITLLPRHRSGNGFLTLAGGGAVTFAMMRPNHNYRFRIMEDMRVCQQRRFSAKGHRLCMAIAHNIFMVYNK